MKKIAVILSGCGYLDGAEITESVSVLIALHQQGAQVRCFAPDMEITVMNHLKGEPTTEKRQVLTEAARICRGHIENITHLSTKDFDGLALPGGFGAAKNLSNWAQRGSQCEVHPEVARVLREFHEQSKPIAAACIAPTLLAKVLGSEHVTLTIGNDKATATEIEKTGARHVDCPVDDYVSDRETKVVTTPAYMYDNATPAEVFKGISSMIQELVEWA